MYVYISASGIVNCRSHHLMSDDILLRIQLIFIFRDRKILPLNKIKEVLVLSTDRDYQSVKNKVKGISSVDTSLLLTLNDLEKLAQYYLVWYRPNNNNERGYDTHTLRKQKQ
jgi:hypothetical protein